LHVANITKNCREWFSKNKKNEVVSLTTSIFFHYDLLSCVFCSFGLLRSYFFEIDTAAVGPLAGVAQGETDGHVVGAASVVEETFAAGTLAPRLYQCAANGGGAVGQSGDCAWLQALQTGRAGGGRAPDESILFCCHGLYGFCLFKAKLHVSDDKRRHLADREC
jgi:hypothetical protein